MPTILEEKDWGLLLRRIKDGKCTPFLGTGICSEKIPVSSKIASDLAKRYGYPMKDSDDLTRVARFVAVTEDGMVPREEICNKIKELVEEVTPKYFKNPDEPHGVLADLPLPVYITTNYDDLMVRALESRGKTPIQKMCLWNKRLMQRKPMSLDFVPTPEKPLVYHLHGCYKQPESLVLTEEDYLEFLVNISKDQEELQLPSLIRAAFTEASLLFLGYMITDWDFRVLFRILAGYFEQNFIHRHMSVQLVPGNVSDSHKEEAQKYLDRYFADLHIQVYWHDCHEFAAELRRRWEAFNGGT